MNGAAPAGHGQSRALLVLLGILWGLNWPAVKVSLTGVSPWALRSIGLGAAACTVFALGLLRGSPLAIRSGRERLHIVVAGLLNVALFNILLTFAQLGAATSRVAIITYSMPLWATLFARFALGERLDALRGGGLLLGASGLLTLLWPLAANGLPQGVLLALGAALSWAAGTVYTKWARLSSEPLAMAGWQLLTGALVALTGLFSFESAPYFPAWHAMRGEVMLALGYHILFGMALAHIIWFSIVARMPAGVAALGTLLVPVVGVTGAVLLLGDQPTSSDLAGFALIFCAALCVLLPRGLATQRRTH
ncbi:MULTISPECIES: DMT family transporter [unclassified Herbaspirillum]|uniref:DMT family transporter n=1 Tax=unclassified Herbaspirillum TaxID=2624150 RepID=UPI0011723547|nr:MULTISPECIES: DMT family transporter [unclassified Herbaspirillum]MBB5389941.1 drug/metabolite transporter (DMT)-like permease [Herbaspirillum sp. SJZ102]TQK09548.1 drug/metabolite transporter (DMT)-like permease [Herbaspirillum sp. SJZ130]TQK13765.1 drug/metabolite transporter (DMT)-like permease [Herbaspirillum sp. SJZ106]TWC69483.1 drug/metabolite transporter (DMT)-like permease [Herbaspirillum sp. SJZ099]